MLLRSAAAVLLAAFGLFAFYQAEQARLPSLDPPETRRLLDEVHQRYGVKINIFAEGAQTELRGLAQAPGVTATQAEPPRANLALLGLYKSHQAYPPAVIRKFLQDIWIVGGLRIRDFPVGGTYIGPRIYLASDAELLIADPAELVRLAEAFPPVEAKARLLARYYARLNPDLRVRLARGPAAGLLE